MIKLFFRRISKTRYVRSAIEDRADLSAFKQKPTPRIIWGLVVIGISYVIGWPLIITLGLIAAYLKTPLIIIIGGPAAYGLSHLVFILGVYLAGALYAKIFMRWSTRVICEKMIGRELETASPAPAEQPPARSARLSR